ncbi:DUF3999 family protein [Oleiharenicola lentus]|uniref:DUF3999 family protein n=1 Tax=Oleiharenicola lentus TaxID=2508720 RepID=A0A4Q1C7T8_9BACT|nr:DUF3999 family protein [Oleiharenicola lentus]RXK54871.1 DUF3999 family protein [Oleiharenicola lentus]
MKKLLRPLRNAIVLGTLTRAVSAFAAIVPTEWRHRQEINVSTPGVIRVELPDATFDAARPDLADLRLLDPDGREIALLVDTPSTPPAHTTRPASFEARLENGNTVLLLGTGTENIGLAAITLETPHPHFLRAAKIEISSDRDSWTSVDEGVPLFRQWGAERLAITLNHRPAAWIRITVQGVTVPFTGASLHFAAAEPVSALPVGARITGRQEFAGETVLTVTLDGKHAPLTALELDTPEPLFMRRVTVAVRDVRDLVPGERIVGSGTLYRVALDGAKPRAQLELNFSHQPLSRELLVHIHNGDSPPLAVNGLRVKREPAGLRFLAPSAGSYTLLAGNPQAKAPRYDLAALVGDLQAATATIVAPGPLQDTTNYQPRASLAEPPLPDVPLTGAPLDPDGWTRRKPVQLAAAGVQELELDAATLAGARHDFADLRLVRAENQIPYLLERTKLARSLTLAPETAPDTRRPSVSTWRLKLPHAGLPLLRLALTSDTPLFQRQFRLYEKVTAGDGRSYEHTLASGEWSRTPEAGSPRTRVFELSNRLQTDTLFLETDNGDNPPVELAGVKAEHAVVRLVFKTAETDGYELLYGNDHTAAPRYDLSLVAPQLLTADRHSARLGAEEAAPAGFARGALRHLKGGYLFWGALSLVVVVLLVVVARLLPKAEASK